MSAQSRRIAHLDMDAFYASVELLRYPELHGLPVVIGGRAEHKPTIQTDGSKHFFKLREYSGRGVITTATYEARAVGVFSAMSVMKERLMPFYFRSILKPIATIRAYSRRLLPALPLR